MMLTPEDLSEEQQQIINALYEDNRLIVAAKGVGKTVCGQTAAQELITDKVCQRVLIVAPLKPALMTWGEEYKKWSHLNEPAMALGTAAQRSAAIESDNPLIVINFENLVWMLEKYDLPTMKIDGLLIDESSKMKSPGGAGVRKLRSKLKHFKWRSALTATPVSENALEIYSQILIVDMGKSLGRNQDAFRRKFFMPTDYLQYNWVLQLGGAERLSEALKNVVFTANDEDYTKNLPELRDHIHRVDLPPKARTAYSKMAKDMMAVVDDVEVEAPSAGVLAQKLQQLASGHIYDSDGVAHQLHSEKITALKKIIKPDCNTLLAYWFKFELVVLREAFPDMKVLSDDPVGLQNNWNAGKVPLLAIHPAATARGVNLQDGGHTLVCMGPVWSLDLTSQLIGRLRRRGQRSKVIDRHTIIASDSVDIHILSRLTGKREAEESIMQHIKQAASGAR